MTQPSPSGHAASERIREWLNGRFGIHFPENKRYLLDRRLAEVIQRFHLKGLPDLAEKIADGQEQDLLMAVMHAASTNHTYFFREPQVLNFFAGKILPPLADRDEVRIWSAAVSTGDEAYTIAIIAAMLWGLPVASRRLAILGTDISEPVIRHAETGLYGYPHVAEVPRDILGRYFRQVDEGQYSVCEGIRKMCTFRRLNLKAAKYPFNGQFDVIFCRNVLYYFERKDQFQVVESLYDACAPGGWLLTSVTESIRDLGTRWTSVDSGILRKRA